MAIPDINTSASGTQGEASRGNAGMMSKVREKATEQLSTQKDKATDGLGSVAQAVRQSTQQLRDQQHDTLAGYVEQAADQIDRLSKTLRNKDIGELFEDAQRLARRNPSMFIGSAFVLGVVGARFLKSSSRPDSDDSRRDRDGRGWQRTGYGSGAYGNEAAGTGTGASTGTTGYTSESSIYGRTPGRANDYGAAGMTPGVTPSTNDTTGAARSTATTTPTTTPAAERGRRKSAGNERP
jgi:hypothetical protein